MNEIKDFAIQLAKMINQRDNKNSPFIVAIDGRCASGKTTLATELEKIISCNIVHMDHFFLRPEQRTPERLSKAGENVDYERFLSEVLIPLKKGEKVSYSPFDCKTMSFAEEIQLDDNIVNIVEGSYSCHNALYKYYDLRVFLNVSEKEQIERIIIRDGKEKAEIFKSKWIPLEENYFKTFNIADRCEVYFSATVNYIKEFYCEK